MKRFLNSQWRTLNRAVQYGLVFSLCFNVILITRWFESGQLGTRPGTATLHRRQNLNWNEQPVNIDPLEIDQQPFYVAGPKTGQPAKAAKAVKAVKSVIATKSQTLRVLKRVRGLDVTVFLYSAVLGNSSRTASWDRLVVQGWQDKNFTGNMSCCVQYQSGPVMSYSAKTLRWTLRPQMVAIQYICALKTRGGDLPKRVAMVTSKQKCHSYFNWYLTPKFSFRHENQIAVCAKLAYGNLSADDILSWFEVHRRLGVEKVLTYTYDLNPEARRVLQYYQTTGLAEVMPFELPYSVKGNRSEVGVKNAQAWTDEQVCVFDCQERLRGFKYLLTIDFDEYLLPNQNKTLNSLFDALYKKRPNAAGFQFLVQMHITSWDQTGTSGSHFKPGQYLNSTNPMVDRLKQVVRPDRLLEGGLSTHNFSNDYAAGYRKFRAIDNEATIHHFRPCRKDWAKRNSTRCMELRRHTDTTVSDFLLNIEKDILDLKRAILDGS